MIIPFAYASFFLNFTICTETEFFDILYTRAFRMGLRKIGTHLPSLGKHVLDTFSDTRSKGIHTYVNHFDCAPALRALFILTWNNKGE